MKNQLKIVLLAVVLLTTNYVSAYDFYSQWNYYNVASLSDFTSKQANDHYAKESKNIMLIAYGFSDKNYEEEIAVNIIDFMTNKWVISIVSDDGVILSGVFTLKSAYKSYYSTLEFMGQGINDKTGEEVEFMVISWNAEVDLSFHSLEKNKDVNMPFNNFVICKDIPSTKILFNNLRWSYDISAPGWKIGTPKQLKKCLSQNPYLRKK